MYQSDTALITDSSVTLTERANQQNRAACRAASGSATRVVRTLVTRAVHRTGAHTFHLNFTDTSVLNCENDTSHVKAGVPKQIQKVQYTTR